MNINKKHSITIALIIAMLLGGRMLLTTKKSQGTNGSGDTRGVSGKDTKRINKSKQKDRQAVQEV